MIFNVAICARYFLPQAFARFIGVANRISLLRRCVESPDVPGSCWAFGCPDSYIIRENKKQAERLSPTIPLRTGALLYTIRQWSDALYKILEYFLPFWNLCILLLLRVEQERCTNGMAA